MKSTNTQPPQDAGEGWKALVNVLLVIHIFCIVVVLSANLSPSPLQSRLLEVLRAYTVTLNFDLNFTPYQLTHGLETDVDHRLEVLPEGKAPEDPSQWIVLPGSGFHGSEAYKRYQRLAAVMGFFAEDDTVSGRIAQNVGNHFLLTQQIVPRQVRCRRHFVQPRTVVDSGTAAQRDPDNPIYFGVPYVANCVVGDRVVGVVRLDDAVEVAQPNQPTNP